MTKPPVLQGVAEIKTVGEVIGPNHRNGCAEGMPIKAYHRGEIVAWRLEQQVGKQTLATLGYIVLDLG